jgi:hypothetical protein
MASRSPTTTSASTAIATPALRSWLAWSSSGLAASSSSWCSLARSFFVVGLPVAGFDVVQRLAAPPVTDPVNQVTPAGQRVFRDCSTLVRESFASPNSSVVPGSYSNSFSMPAKPGRIERLRKTTAFASPTSRIGMP